jgi:arylsulfatase
MPIDGSMLERMNVERPTIAKPRDSFIYYPGGSPVPFSAAPKVYNRAFSITAEVHIPEAGAEGVLIAHGGRVGGYSFFVKDNTLHFVYNFLGRDFFTVVSNTEVPVGDVALRYELEPTGEPDFAAGKGVPARGELYIDKKLVGAVDMPHTVPNLFSTEGLTCGHDGGSRVAPDDYADAFPFTGTLKRVTIDLSGDLIVDSATDMKVAMARQ